MSDRAVAYLVSRYPGLSLTFIEREIKGLRALGLDVRTFSIRPPVPDELLTSAMQEEAANSLVLLADRSELLRQTIELARNHPSIFVHMLSIAGRSGPAHPKGRLWQLFYLVEAVRLHHELRTQGIRHVHVHFANNGADVARLAVALGRALDGPNAGWRWTMTMHGPTEFENITQFDLVRKVRDADAIACISDFTRSQLMRLLPPSHWAKLRIVRMSVDTQRFRARERADRVGAVRILNVGRLVPEKGAPLLLESVRRVISSGRRTTLRIVGAGDLDHDLADQIRRLDLAGSVELLGPVGQDDLPSLYEWADMFCLPSFQEGLPVVLIEAMASGLPVVTTRIAGIPELVDESNGRVVTPGRADLLADALAEMIDDVGVRGVLGANGRRRIEREFSITTTSRSQREFLRAT